MRLGGSSTGRPSRTRLQCCLYQFFVTAYAVRIGCALDDQLCGGQCLAGLLGGFAHESISAAFVCCESAAAVAGRQYLVERIGAVGMQGVDELQDVDLC